MFFSLIWNCGIIIPLINGHLSSDERRFLTGPEDVHSSHTSSECFTRKSGTSTIIGTHCTCIFSLHFEKMHYMYIQNPIIRYSSILHKSLKLQWGFGTILLSLLYMYIRLHKLQVLCIWRCIYVRTFDQTINFESLLALNIIFYSNSFKGCVPCG